MRRSLLNLISTVVIIVLINTVPSVKTYAQQDPLYSHYMFNTMIYNPAYAGTNREYINATFLLHNQWLGFEGPKKEKGPTTQTFTIHAPLKSEYLGGVGLGIINDAQGWEQTISANLSFSGRYNLSFGSLHYGLNGGIIQRTINGDWIPPEPGKNDPILPNGSQTAMTPDVGLGVYLYTPWYYIGFSSQHIIGGEFKWAGYSGNTLVRQSYLTAGLSIPFPTNMDLKLMPSTLIKFDQAKIQYDINCNVMYKERFWGGLLYRNGVMITGLLGMYLTPQLKFGYSYDFTTNQLRSYNTGTHEVMISYDFKIVTKTKVVIPNIIWTPRYLKP